MNNSNSAASSFVHSYLPGNVWHYSGQDNYKTALEIKVEPTPALKKIVINDHGDIPTSIIIGMLFLGFLLFLCFGCKDK